MEENINEIVSKMTLEEKAGLCSGLNHWETKPVERLGIPSIMMADGPHGLRKQERDPDHIALSGSIPATCYPAASALACSWDRDLVKGVGAHLGTECQAQNIDIILGPGANIKRSPSAAGTLNTSPKIPISLRKWPGPMSPECRGKV